ncbi:hypothetical protein LTR15_005914 [Elasticomyces elasticus]|nr:hypothetical protein LTR15_005914 [Elasticomyces elasticus]
MDNSLCSGFLPFPDTYISSNLAPINEESVAPRHEHATPSQSARQSTDNNTSAPPRKRVKLNHACALCGTSYTEKRALARHQHSDQHRGNIGLPPLEKYHCLYPSCSRSFSRNHDRQRHEDEVHKDRKRASTTRIPSPPSAQPSTPSRLDLAAVEGVSEVTSFFNDAASTTSDGWSGLAPQVEVFPGPATRQVLASEQQTQRTANMAWTSNIEAASRSQSPGSYSNNNSTMEYRSSQSWFDEDSDTEDDDRAAAMESRPDTQLSQKTAKSTAEDSAIDMSDDQPHEPKRPSITTYDYSSERPRPTDKQGSQDDRAEVPATSFKPTLPVFAKQTIIQKNGKVITLSAAAPTHCVFCDLPLSSDKGILMSHLREHMDAIRGDPLHICHICNVGFVHKADLDKHKNSANFLSHCGFKFQHHQPCTGHHPPEVVSNLAFTDRDSFRLCEQLRHWEFGQLRAYIETINQLVARSNCETGTTYSVEALVKKNRGSMSSYAISVNTYGSAPCDRDTNGQLDIGGLRHRLKMMSLKGSAKLPQLLRTASAPKALYNAATSGDLAQIRTLVESGADPNAVFNGDQSILSAAAQWANIDTVNLLIELGASVHIPERKYGSPLASAAHAGKLDVCETLLIAGASVHQVGGKYGCPLGAAAASGNIAVANWLLDHGAKVKQQGGPYFYPLNTAATYGRVEMVNFLLENGADVNQTGGDQGSALGFAVWNGHANTARELIDHGADANASTPKYGSILTAAIVNVAIRDATIELIRLLLESGADATQQGSHTPLNAAAMTADVEGMSGVVKLLLEYDTDAHAAADALQMARRVRQKLMDNLPFSSYSHSESVADKIGHCHEVIRLLKGEATTEELPRRLAFPRVGVVGHGGNVRIPA